MKKAEEKDMPDGRKTKKRKLAPIIGWGEGSSQQEELQTKSENITRLTDWTEPSTVMNVNTKQSTIKDWVKADNFPEGWKVYVQKKDPKATRRTRGKLTRKEEKNMKASHRDNGQLLAPKPSKESLEHEKMLENEIEYDPKDLESIEKEKEERISRIKQRSLEWQAMQFCRSMVSNLVEDARLKSERRVCEQVMDSVIVMAWETLEVNRIVKETLAGSNDMMDRIRKALNLEKGLSMETKMMEHPVEHPVEETLDEECVHWQGAHTPPPRPSTHTDCDISVMTALHTPVLGPEHIRDILDRQPDEENSGAGIIPPAVTGYVQCVQSEKTTSDMRKLEHHRSPEFVSNIKFDKTSTMVGGKLEKFGSIFDMIEHWEGLEKEGEEGEPEKSGRGLRGRGTAILLSLEMGVGDLGVWVPKGYQFFRQF